MTKSCPLCNDNHTLSQCSRWRVGERRQDKPVAALLRPAATEPQYLGWPRTGPVAWVLRSRETHTFSGGSVHQSQNLPKTPTQERA